MSEIFGFDAYAPKEIAERVQTVGVTKARLPLLTQLVLGTLAGGFIGLGALYFTIVASDATLSFAASRLLGGLVVEFPDLYCAMTSAADLSAHTPMVLEGVNFSVEK